MIAGVLLDYHYPNWWPSTIMRLAPSLKVRSVGSVSAPKFDAPDPEILNWLEAHQFILVTNNRSSMPLHLADHVARGRQVQGLFVAEQDYEIHELAEQLELIVGASFQNEFQNQIRFLPVW